MCFPYVLFDEAAQAIEPAVLVSICKACEQLVLVGDHFQLPPVVSSQAAEKSKLAQSLFERLCVLGVEPVLLNIQYRMHAATSAFPSKYMYNNMIRDGHDSVSWAAPAGFPWPVPSKPLCFVDCNEQEQKTGTSYTNTLEREVIAKVIGLLAGHVPFEDIGVITGYKTQRELLKDSLDLGVDVNSIDGFQGREKDVIIISTLRCNQEGRVGFLQARRWVNVAMTRSRYGLIVLGCMSTLKQEVRTWHDWLVDMSDQGLVLTSDALSA